MAALPPQQQVNRADLDKQVEIRKPEPNEVPARSDPRVGEERYQRAEGGVVRGCPGALGGWRSKWWCVGS